MRDLTIQSEKSDREATAFEILKFIFKDFLFYIKIFLKFNKIIILLKNIYFYLKKKNKDKKYEKILFF